MPIGDYMARRQSRQTRLTERKPEHRRDTHRRTAVPLVAATAFVLVPSLIVAVLFL